MRNQIFFSNLICGKKQEMCRVEMLEEIHNKLFYSGAVPLAMAMRHFKTGFHLTIHDLYFKIPAEIFANHILA